MVFLKKIKAKLKDFLQLEEECKACRKHTWTYGPPYGASRHHSPLRGHTGHHIERLGTTYNGTYGPTYTSSRYHIGDLWTTLYIL